MEDGTRFWYKRTLECLALPFVVTFSEKDLKNLTRPLKLNLILLNNKNRPKVLENSLFKDLLHNHNSS